MLVELPPDTPPAGGTRPVDITGATHVTPPPQVQDTSENTRFSWMRSRAEAMSYVREFRFTKKIVTIGIISLMIVSSLVIGIVAHRRDVAKKAGGNSGLSASVEDVEYQTLLPNGKSITELGGWKRVSPSESEPVFAYTDKIGETSINVSQQPLPKSFIGDTDNQVEELAKKFNATSKIDAGNVKVFVGSSTKGPQSAIFTKNSLLILIKSHEKIDDASWAKYIKSLN